MSQGAHHQQDLRAVGCGVITVSDTRTAADDRSGQLIQRLVSEAGHRIEAYRIVRDEPAAIAAAIAALPAGAAVVMISGGTGVAQRDTTFEAVRGLLDKEITGFGELFRMLSYEQIGAAAMLSRATAGIAGERVLFSMPGSAAAVELAMTRLIVPVLGHVVGLLRG